MTQSLMPGGELLKSRGRAQKDFHEQAAQAARKRFGNRVFVRAVVEVSNFCRENCAYCGMRRDNRNLTRFRAHHDQLAELLIHHRPASVTDVNIQAGEDPVAVREVVLPLIKTLRRETNLGVSVCLGSLSPAMYAELKEAGASIYIIKFEMANPVLRRNAGAGKIRGTHREHSSPRRDRLGSVPDSSPACPVRATRIARQFFARPRSAAGWLQRQPVHSRRRNSAGQGAHRGH